MMLAEIFEALKSGELDDWLDAVSLLVFLVVVFFILHLIHPA